MAKPVADRKNDLVVVLEIVFESVLRAELLALFKNDLVGVRDPVADPVAVGKNVLVGVSVSVFILELVVTEVGVLRYDLVGVPEFVVTEVVDAVVEYVGKGETLIRKDLLGVSEPVLEGVAVNVPAFVLLFVFDVVTVAVTEFIATTVWLPLLDTLREGSPEVVTVKLVREDPVGAEVLTGLPDCVEEAEPNALAVGDVDTLFRELPVTSELTVLIPLRLDKLEGV